MKKAKIIVLWLVVILFLVGVIPIIINEAYKYGALHGGYITMWDAADVLSFYGSLLGTIATIGALIATISFTQQQIYRDSYLKSEDEKWTKIETVFANALNSINPMLPILGTMDTGFTDPSSAITTIQKYQISCKIATDQLNMCLNTTDYPKVKQLIEAINNFSECISPICAEEIELYSKLRDLLNRDTAKRTMAMETQYPGSFPTETLSFCSRIIDDTNGLNSKDIEDAIGQLKQKIVEIYQNSYRSLLQLKGATFEEINTEIQRNADRILHLWRRK